MYRLIMYYVAALWSVAVILSLFGLLPYSTIELVLSAVTIFAICLVTNKIFARVFGAPSNIESVYTTALILVVIVAPMRSVQELPFVIWVAILAMASKYILAINKKHVFNPAAVALALTAVTLKYSANWWVDSIYLMPIVVIGGLLVVRKIRRFDLVLSFIVTCLLVVAGLTFFKDGNIWLALQKNILYSPMLFFAFAMLTEPATTPPTRKLRIMYGALVGFFFNPFVHIGSFYFIPETALVLGNIFSYLVSPKFKLVLQLKEKIMSADNVYDFWFKPERKLQFQPGQYLEWTLGHEHQDNRGMRRYFTIASSPTEDGVMAGVKFYPNSSTFKKSMLSLEVGDQIVAAQLAGDFTMPKDVNKKLVFMAGGIGVTPFRSMIKYLMDRKEKRDITFFYSNYGINDVAYKDLFDKAQQQLGIKMVYTLTNQPAPKNWQGETGFVDEAMIRRCVPDFKERTFYISGSHTMVVIFSDILSKMGVPKHHIKTDFFPGFA